jgi:hypothetical protein
MAGDVEKGKEREKCGREHAARDATHRDGTATSRASASEDETWAAEAAVVAASSGNDARKES